MPTVVASLNFVLRKSIRVKRKMIFTTLSPCLSAVAGAATETWYDNVFHYDVQQIRFC